MIGYGGVQSYGVYLLFVVPPMLLGLAAQAWIKNAFARWSEVSSGPYSGADIARRILAANGLGVMPVTTTPGNLSDHCDPRDRSIHLSAAVANSSSVASISVAAHEVGHAIQHARGMALFRFRSALATPAQLTSNWCMPLLVVGVLARSLNLVVLAIILFSVAVLFQLVTLPVEIDASRRARSQLNALGMFRDPQVAAGSRNVLTAAAMTYVAASLAAVAQLAYFVLMFLGNERR